MSTSETGNPFDAVPDLDLATADLARREETLRRELERSREVLAEAAELGDALGTGYAEDGAVRITVDAQQRVVGVGLDPRALRLGSINKLEHAILDACQAAQDDIARQLGRRTADPVRELLDSMPELVQLLPEESYSAFFTPTRPAPRRPPDDQDRSIYE